MDQENKIRQRIQKNLSKIKDEKVKKQIEQEILTDELEEIMFRINYKHEDLVEEALQKAKKIDELKDWPENKQKFWNMEAINWKLRMPKNVKEFISFELNKKIKRKNLDIGSGSTNYTKNTTSLDISKEMLEWNPNKKKVQANAEQLPFKNKTFDTATLIFTANYVENQNKMIKELARVLKKNGIAIFVQSAKPVHKLHRLAENKEFNIEKLVSALKKQGFKTKKENKKTENTELIFIEATRS